MLQLVSSSFGSSGASRDRRRLAAAVWVEALVVLGFIAGSVSSARAAEFEMSFASIERVQADRHLTATFEQYFVVARVPTEVVVQPQSWPTDGAAFPTTPIKALWIRLLSPTTEPEATEHLRECTKFALIAQARPADYDLQFNFRLSDGAAAAGYVFASGASLVVDVREEVVRIHCRLVRTTFPAAASTATLSAVADSIDGLGSDLPEGPSSQPE